VKAYSSERSKGRPGNHPAGGPRSGGAMCASAGASGRTGSCSSTFRRCRIA